MGFTCFQEGHDYGDGIAVKSDVAIVYGCNDTLASRVRKWKEKGYRVHFMTGIAWGNYGEYDSGLFDGVEHEDEAQMEIGQVPISHGGSIKYMVPTLSYIEYMKSMVKKAIDVGVEAIYLEEPEFWIRGGYSPAFMREWEKFYREPWIPPDASVKAAFKSARLMYYLYKRAVQIVADFIKDYGRKLNRDVKCYIATHSLINYTHWRIVSPEFSIDDVQSVDGYVGQVWTGTARTMNVYQGIKKERTFETAFLEYGVLENLVYGNKRDMIFLTDPIEDDPRHSWNDYKKNYEATLIASLLYPKINNYEVMPWPHRIFYGVHPKIDLSELSGFIIDKNNKIDINKLVGLIVDSAKQPIVYDKLLKGYLESQEKERIPQWYAIRRY